MRNSTRVCAALALTAGLVAGCTSAEDPPADTGTTGEEVVTDHQPDEPAFTPGEDESPEPIAGQDGAATAMSTAADELGGQAFQLTRVDDGGEELWAVNVAVGDETVEAHVSLDGNAIVHQGQAATLDAEDRQLLDETSVAASEAAVNAANDLGGTVEEVNLTEAGGSVVWEIALRTTDGAITDTTVDAVTGEVL